MSQDQQQLSAKPQMDSQLEKRQELGVIEQSQLVPVSEAIKYRKRAQAAEEQVEQLSRQLQEQQQEQNDMQVHLEKTKLENELTRELVKAGAIDIEVASLLVNKRKNQENGEQADIKSLIGNLRNERPSLFANSLDDVINTLASPTAGVRSRKKGGESSLSRLAQQVQRSGSRKDMQDYLRLRRSVVR